MSICFRKKRIRFYNITAKQRDIRSIINLINEKFRKNYLRFSIEDIIKL